MKHENNPGCSQIACGPSAVMSVMLREMGVPTYVQYCYYSLEREYSFSL